MIRGRGARIQILTFHIEQLIIRLNESTFRIEEAEKVLYEVVDLNREIIHNARNAIKGI